MIQNTVHGRVDLAVDLPITPLMHKILSLLLVAATFCFGLWGLPTQPHRSVQAVAKDDLDFVTPTIALQHFRETYKHLDDAVFAKKLEAALQAGPVLFFRSFVNTYYADIATQLDTKDLVLCFGDPHPENFGFLEFPSGTRFVFNDLDDSGFCPLQADALRYFVAVALTYDDSQLLQDLVHEYVLVLNDKKKAALLDKDLIPNLEKRRNKLLKKLTQGNVFLESEELTKIPASSKTKMLTDLKIKPVFADTSILDIAEVARYGGGSGGLKRYLLLLENSRGKDLLELKQLATPGTSFGHWPHPEWSYSERIDELKQEFWHESPQYYEYIFSQEHYLLRSRIRDSVELEKLSGDELQDYLRAQVGIIASHHKIYKKRDIPNLEKWLQKNIPALQNRYLETYQNLKRP